MGKMVTWAFLISILFWAVEAQAQPVTIGEEGELAKLVPPEPGAHACFKRVYDAEHLAKHPDQTVTSMELRLAYYAFDPDKYNPKGQRNYFFDLVVQRRGETRKLSGIGECIPYGFWGISCGIDCDGGGLDITRKLDGSVVVDLTPFGRIRMTRSCGDGQEDYVDLEPGKDDKTFRLYPMEQEECLAYSDW